MEVINPKPLHAYPIYLRWFFRRQQRLYGQTLSPSWLWGRLPAHFLGLLLMLWLFSHPRFPLSAPLRALVSTRVAQINGCAFCVDLNSFYFVQSTGDAANAKEKIQRVAHWRESADYSPCERALLDYAEAMTDTALRAEPRHFEALRQYFDDDGLTALTAWIAFQNFSAKFNSALGAQDHQLCSFNRD